MDSIDGIKSIEGFLDFQISRFLREKLWMSQVFYFAWSWRIGNARNVYHLRKAVSNSKVEAIGMEAAERLNAFAKLNNVLEQISKLPQAQGLVVNRVKKWL